MQTACMSSGFLQFAWSQKKLEEFIHCYMQANDLKKMPFVQIIPRQDEPLLNVML
jgi:hypothetical protein